MNKEQANRCLGCANPFCEKGCPINTPIKEVIRLYNQNKIREAGELLFENNPFSALCGILCPHERHCEGSCVLGIKGEPVQFGSIEAEISKTYLKQLSFETPIITQANVAIVGAGPSGLTSAIDLARSGYDVTLYDEHHTIGGILTYGIPQFRFDHDLIEEYQRIIEELNIKVIHKQLGTDITLKELEDNYEYVILAFGLANSIMIDVEGNDNDNVLLGTDFLLDACHKDYDDLIVIGTGNVAMDVARSAKACGAKNVTVIRRRGSENMSATQAEINDALADGVEFEFFLAPYKFKKDRAIFLKTIEKDGEIITTEEEVTFKADYIVLATGQEADKKLLEELNLELTEYNTLKTNEFNQTSNPKVFASGDINLGARTIVEAVSDAKKVSESIKRLSK